MKTKIIFFFILTITICLTASAALWVPWQPLSPDVIAINRIKNHAETSWPNLFAKDFQTYPYPFSIVNSQGILLFQTSSETSGSVFDAVSQNDIILEFAPEGNPEGSLLIHTGLTGRLRKQQIQNLRFFLLIVLLLIVSAGAYQFYLHQKIIAPFKNLQGFARRIAAGNLDIPLDMDQNHLFGAFTESFDIMRDQLKESRRAEALANQSKKELVASLSHDIKTPVTSIKLVSELLRVTAPTEYQEKLGTIYTKADQIDRLVTNLFQSALEELGQLKIHLSETDSAILNQIFQDANYYQKLSYPLAPGCLISTDQLRLEQVIDNVITNSYKYANTKILVTYELSAEFLVVHIRDYGSGVSEEELPQLFHKFYRGSKAIDSKLDGSGLGLYIAKDLMERMEGDISIENREEGLCVTLLLPLV